MPTKKKILKDLEKEVVHQNREKPEIERYEKVSGKELDKTRVPAIDVGERLEKEWKEDEEEREISEPKELINEGMGIEKEEEKGEESYPEIEKAITEEADEEEESEDEQEEKKKEEEEK